MGVMEQYQNMGEKDAERNRGEGENLQGLSSQDRSMLRKLRSYLGFADFMAFLMVAATAFTGLATWRTASIANQLLLSSERPYFGVESVKFDRRLADDPRVLVDLRNFGPVPADDVYIQGDLIVNGRLLRATAVNRNAGIMSPKVPHYIHIHISKDQYAMAMAGHVNLGAQISAWYQNAAGLNFCYRERFSYVPDSDNFEIVGGTSKCITRPPSPDRGGPR